MHRKSNSASVNTVKNAIICIFGINLLIPGLIFSSTTLDTITTPLARFGFGNLTTLAAAPDGKTFLTGSRDGKARLWDVESRQVIRTFSGHTDSINFVSYAPDGKTFATASGDSTVKLWNVETGKTLRTLSGHTVSVKTLAFSRDGSKLASSSYCWSKNGEIKVWNTATGECTNTFKTTWDIKAVSLAFGPLGTTLLVGLETSNVAELWDLDLDSCIMVLKGSNSNSSKTVAISSDGLTALITGFETAQLYSLLTGTIIRTFNHASYGSLYSAVFSPDEKYILTTTSSTVWLWPISGQALPIKFPCKGEKLFRADFIPDEKSVIAGSRNNLICKWDTVTPYFSKPYYGHTEQISAIAISPDGNYLYAASPRDEKTKMWSVNGDTCIHHFSELNYLKSFSVSPDGARLALPDWNNTIVIRDVFSGTALDTLGSNSSNVQNSTKFSPDGKLLISCNRDGTITLWDVATGDSIGVFSGHTGGVNDALFLPDGKSFISGSNDKTAKLWDIATRKCIRTFRPKDTTSILSYNGVNKIQITPDHKTLITQYYLGRLVYFWDIATGDSLRVYKCDRNRLEDIALSADGTSLLLGMEDSGVIGQLDIASNTVIKVYKGQAGPVTALAFAPDGNSFFSAANDGSIFKWNLAHVSSTVHKAYLDRQKELAVWAPNRRTLHIEGLFGMTGTGILELYQISGKSIYKIFISKEVKNSGNIKLQAPLTSGLYYYRISNSSTRGAVGTGHVIIR